MEWDRIERKWADMTRRVRSDLATCKADLLVTNTGPDSQTKPDIKERQGVARDKADQVAAR